MNLYLVRHGDALSDAQDPARALSPNGRRELEQLAGALAPHIRATTIVHSGKTRAEQSAEILRAKALTNASVEVQAGLNPNDDVAGMADALQHESRELVVVGHLPYVSRLASLLTCGDAERTVFAFDTGTCLALERLGTNWCVRWMLDPRLL